MQTVSTLMVVLNVDAKLGTLEMESSARVYIFIHSATIDYEISSKGTFQMWMNVVIEHSIAV